MTAYHGSPFSTIQIPVTYFSSNFDSVCGILHGLIRACISEPHNFNVAVHRPPDKSVY